MDTHTQELKSRVEAKKKKIEADLAQAKANAHGKKSDIVDKLESSMKEINTALKDGWNNLTENTSKKINQWLKH